MTTCPAFYGRADPGRRLERYDRLINSSGKVVRLHQEDFCQALSVPPALKYEDEGGPGIATAQQLIAAHTRRPAADRLAFLRMVIFHYLIGNADAHAKNFALLYRDRSPDLAPLYDVICTAAYPNLTRKLAMQIGGRGLSNTIQLQHWQTLVSDAKPAQRLLLRNLKEMSETVLEQANLLLPELQEEGIDHPVLDKVLAIINTRTRHIQRLTSFNA